VSQAGVTSLRTGGGATTETLTGNSGGAVSPDASFNINIVGNNTSGINIVGVPAANTLTVVAYQGTTTQQGTLTLATNAETIAGTDTAKAITADDLKAKLGTQTAHGVLVAEGTSSALTALAVGTNGQVLLGSTGADPVFATLTSSDSSISFTTGAGTLSLQVAGGTTVGKTITGNSGGALSPTAGNWNILGTGSITTSGSGSTLTTQLTGLTNHSLLVGAGTATITNLGIATNGQLPIGSTGADPVLATLTAGANITITNGAGSITIAANAGAATINYVSTTSTTYVALSTDDYISARIGEPNPDITIQLPNAPTTGRVFTIKDRNGQSNGSNIHVTTVGGIVTFDGSAIYTFPAQLYFAINVIFNGTNYEVF
jgi:hypothetical protein